MRLNDAGFLFVNARTARIGIQEYAGYEVGKSSIGTVRVYRPESEVFNKASLASFTHKTVTNEHPPTLVDAGNWKEFAVGHSTGDIARDGEFLRIPLMLSDGQTVKDIQGGKRELSAGYCCDLDWTAGITPDGRAYEAIQRNIRGNHIAVVDRGRAGHSCRIGDHNPWGKEPLNQKEENCMETRTVVVDGLSVETTDAGAQAISKLTQDYAKLVAKVAESAAKHTVDIANKDVELAKRDAEIKTLEDKLPDQATLDKMVAERAALTNSAGILAPKVSTGGLSNSEIKSAVVADVLGADLVKDKSEMYIDARFDILTEDAKKKPGGFVDALSGSKLSGARMEDERQAAFDALVKFDVNGKD